MRRIFFAILILTTSQLIAQVSIKETSFNLQSAPEERIILHTDRDFYLSGEKIWFKSYCLYNNTLLDDNLSRVLYVELYNSELNLKQKFQIANGISSGSIQIPSDFKTGNYILRAYTHYIQNFDVENYFSKTISIVNPNEPPTIKEIKIIEDSTKALLGKTEVDDNLKISVNKNHFDTREMVTLTLGPNFIDAKQKLNLAVSIVKKGTINNTIKQSKKSEFLNSNSVIKWLPEIRDVSISGIAYNTFTNNPVSNLPIYISAFKNPAQIHIIRTNQNGEFIYSLNSLKDRRDIFIGPYSKQGEPIELQINNDFSTAFADIKLNEIEIDSTKKILIEELNINYQAGNIYNTDPGTKEIETKSLPFHFNTPPFSVNLDKYIDTPTLEMVFDELMPRCIVTKRQGNFQLIVDNEEEDILYKDPLVLIDNIPVFDMNRLMEIHPSKIEKIAVYPAPLVLGDNIIEGLVLITTRTDNFCEIKMPEGSVFLNYHAISTSNQFEAPMYDSKEKQQSRLADFRTTLYWNPELILEKEKQIKFYTSDHESEYEVIVRGYSAEGEFYYGKASFRVVNK